MLGLKLNHVSKRGYWYLWLFSHQGLALCSEFISYEWHFSANCGEFHRLGVIVNHVFVIRCIVVAIAVACTMSNRCVSAKWETIKISHSVFCLELKENGMSSCCDSLICIQRVVSVGSGVLYDFGLKTSIHSHNDIILTNFEIRPL